jgi:hypothetical protein
MMMFKSLMKAAVGIVTAPIDVVADIATLGGTLNDKEETYTGKKLSDVMENLADASDPEKD